MKHKFWTGLVMVWIVSLMLCNCGGGGTSGKFQFGNSESSSSYVNWFEPNRLIATQYTSAREATIDYINIAAVETGNVKAAIYSDDSNYPATLLASQNTGVYCTGGSFCQINLRKPYTAAAKTKYWIAIIMDGQGVVGVRFPSAASYWIAKTYSGFTFPSTFPAKGSCTSGTIDLGTAAWGH